MLSFLLSCLFALEQKKESKYIISIKENTWGIWLKLNVKKYASKKINYLSNITALGSELVNLRLSNVSTLFSLLHLMLYLPQLGKVSIGLFLLQIHTQLYQEQKISNVYKLFIVVLKGSTHSFFRLPLVSLDLQLKLVNQILQSVDVLLILLSLQIMNIHQTGT